MIEFKEFINEAEKIKLTNKDVIDEIFNKVKSIESYNIHSELSPRKSLDLKKGILLAKEALKEKNVTLTKDNKNTYIIDFTKLGSGYILKVQ